MMSRVTTMFFSALKYILPKKYQQTLSYTTVAYLKNPSSWFKKKSVRQSCGFEVWEEDQKRGLCKDLFCITYLLVVLY